MIFAATGDGWSLEHAGQRLLLTRGLATLTLEVKAGDGWRGSAIAPSPLISGLDLVLDEIVPAEHGAALRGPTWCGRIEPVGNLFHFTLDVDLAAPVDVPPELILWVGPFDLMDDRQALTWRRTLVSGPTANGQGLPGNDLPAVYLYDPVRKAETVLAVDAGAMDWAPGRLLGYRCTERFDERGGRYGAGLVRTGTAFTLSGGRHRFGWYLWQGPRQESPDAWTGAARLVEQLAPVLSVPNTTPAPSWRERAAGCVQDLADREACWVEPEGVPGLRAYVKNTSRYFGEQGRNFFELMTHMDVAAPLALYQQLQPTPQGEELLTHLLASLPRFHRPEIGWMVNSFPGGSTFADLWYPFENSLIKLGWLTIATADEQLRAMWQNVLGGARRLAEETGNLFPLFCETATGESRGSAPNVSVAGLYAFGNVLADQAGMGQSYADAARQALRTMRRLPLELQHHEPQQLAFAAAAAALLGERSLANDFLNAQLRQLYWFADPGAGEADVRGMFQACASLLYPAFKENVEAILPWTILLKEGVGEAALLLRIIALQRAHNQAYFDSTACPHIPYENLGTSELPQRGAIGKEIYGAGEVLWLYLMTEAFGTADDPDILVVALDLLTPARLAHPSDPGGAFVLFNPTETARSFRFAGAEYALEPGAYVIHASKHQPEGGTPHASAQASV